MEDDREFEEMEMEKAHHSGAHSEEDIVDAMAAVARQAAVRQRKFVRFWLHTISDVAVHDSISVCYLFDFTEVVWIHCFQRQLAALFFKFVLKLDLFDI